MYYSYYTIGGVLCHHGILGQKWGKKNGPPYPLGSGDHSASEKKAGWRKSLERKINRYKNPVYRYVDKTIKKMSKEDQDKMLETLDKATPYAEKITKITHEMEDIYNKTGNYNDERFQKLKKSLDQYNKKYNEIMKSNPKFDGFVADELNQRRSSNETNKIPQLRVKEAINKVDKMRNQYETQKKERSIKKAEVFDNNINDISKDVANQLASDKVRWGDIGSKDKEKIEKEFNKQIKDRIKNRDKNSAFEMGNDKIEISINGLKDYSDYAPLILLYDTKTKKTDIYYL